MDESSKYGGKIDAVSLTNFSILEDVDTPEWVEHDFNAENGADNDTQGTISTFRKWNSNTMLQNNIDLFV